MCFLNQFTMHTYLSANTEERKACETEATEPLAPRNSPIVRLASRQPMINVHRSYRKEFHLQGKKCLGIVAGISITTGVGKESPVFNVDVLVPHWPAIDSVGSWGRSRHTAFCISVN